MMRVDIRETLNGLIGLCKDSEATFAYCARVCSSSTGVACMGVDSAR